MDVGERWMGWKLWGWVFVTVLVAAFSATREAGEGWWWALLWFIPKIIISFFA